MGKDEKGVVDHDHNTSFVWFLNWDDKKNATEFENAMESYLDKRGMEKDGKWIDGNVTFDLRRTDNKTVALVIGTDSFVDKVDITNENGIYTVNVRSQRD